MPDPWSNQLISLLLIAAASSGFSGLFVYSPAPGKGNLIASVAASPGTDPFGNPYQQGITSYAGGGSIGVVSSSLEAGAVIVGNTANAEGLGGPASTNPGGLSILVPAANNENGGLIVSSPTYAPSPPAESANLILQGESEDGTAPSYAEFINGDSTKICPVSIQGLIFPEQATQPVVPPDLAPAIIAYGDASGGSVDVVNQSLLWGHLPVNRVDSNQHTVTQATLTNITAIPTGILANDANSGTLYRITCGGHGTQGSTQQALSFQITLGSTALGGTTMASTTIPASTAFHWNFIGNILVTNTGSSATVFCWGIFEFSVAAAGGTSGTAAFDTASATFNSTIANAVQVQMRWGSATGAPTITCDGAMLERLGV